MKAINNLIRKIIAFFTSGKAEAALTQAAELVPKALPIIQEIAALCPNRTDQEIAAAYQNFAVPFSSQILSAPMGKRGYVLLQLATDILAAEFPGTATHILNTAIQLAFTASHS